MKSILSYSCTLVAEASRLHFKDETFADPRLAAAIVNHPPGSVLDFDDDKEAQRLIDSKLAVEWDPSEHGADPVAIMRSLNRPQIQAPQPGVPGVHHA